MYFAAEDKDSAYNEMDSGMIRTPMDPMTLKEERAGAGVSFTLPEPGYTFTEVGNNMGSDDRCGRNNLLHDGKDKQQGILFSV